MAVLLHICILVYALRAAYSYRCLHFEYFCVFVFINKETPVAESDR